MNKRGIPVIDVLTGKQYDSVAHAAKKHKCSESLMMDIIEQNTNQGANKLINGEMLKYLVNTPANNRQISKKRLPIKVKNITTGKEFDDIDIAAKEYEVSRESIQKACSKRTRSCKGCEWEYSNKKTELRHKKANRVKNITTGEEFDSAVLAADKNDISVSSIRTAIRTKSMSVGCYWMYNNEYLKQVKEGKIKAVNVEHIKIQPKDVDTKENIQVKNIEHQFTINIPKEYVSVLTINVV